MCSRISLFVVLATVAQGLFAEEPQKTTTKSDRFSLEFIYDADFPGALSLGWQHSFTSTDALETNFYYDAFDQTLILIEDWQHTFGDLMIGLGFTTTFGTASWNGTAADKKTYVFRDIGPAFIAIYSNKYFYAETLNLFYFPTQQDPATAITLGISRFFVAPKWNEYGIGPRLELFFSKEGHNPMSVVECRIGGSIFKHWETNSIDLFVGYNPISSPSFLGRPLNAAPVFRASFVQLF